MKTWTRLALRMALTLPLATAAIGCGSSTSLDGTLADLTVSSSAHAFIKQNCSDNNGPLGNCSKSYRLYISEIDLTAADPRAGTHLIEFELKTITTGVYEINDKASPDLELDAKRFDDTCRLRTVESLKSADDTETPGFVKRTISLDQISWVTAAQGGFAVQRVVGTFELERTDGSYLRGSFDAVPGKRRETTACEHVIE